MHAVYLTISLCIRLMHTSSLLFLFIQQIMHISYIHTYLCISSRRQHSTNSMNNQNTVRTDYFPLRSSILSNSIGDKIIYLHVCMYVCMYVCDMFLNIYFQFSHRRSAVDKVQYTYTYIHTQSHTRIICCTHTQSQSD